MDLGAWILKHVPNVLKKRRRILVLGITAIFCLKPKDFMCLDSQETNAAGGAFSILTQEKEYDATMEALVVSAHKF